MLALKGGGEVGPAHLDPIIIKFHILSIFPPIGKAAEHRDRAQMESLDPDPGFATNPMHDLGQSP